MSSSSSSSSSSMEEAVSVAPATTLAKVETILISYGKAVTISSASDDKETINTLRAGSLSFGTIAPGETSKTIIIALNIPNTYKIGNIKLGLMSVEGVDFANNIFGITSSPVINTSLIPANYFQNLNDNDSDTNEYNISIDNQSYNMSNYVYLNMSLPLKQLLGVGNIVYKWFFDYVYYI